MDIPGPLFHLIDPKHEPVRSTVEDADVAGCPLPVLLEPLRQSAQQSFIPLPERLDPVFGSAVHGHEGALLLSSLIGRKEADPGNLEPFGQRPVKLGCKAVLFIEVAELGQRDLRFPSDSQRQRLGELDAGLRVVALGELRAVSRPQQRPLEDLHHIQVAQENRRPPLPEGKEDPAGPPRLSRLTRLSGLTRLARRTVVLSHRTDRKHLFPIRPIGRLDNPG